MLTEIEAREAIDNILRNTSDVKNPMKFIRSIIKEKAISKVNDTIAVCDDCKLNAKIKTIGYGNLNASVMIVCDYPLEEQISVGEKIIPPLYGTKYVDILKDLFKQLGVNKDEIYWLNTMQCYPQSKDGEYRCPRVQEIEKCSVFMKYIVDVIHPSMIILLGAVALNCFKKASMNKIHGQWIDAYTIPAMPTYSPAYIEQLEKLGYDSEKIVSLKNAMCKDIESAFKYLQDKYPYNNVIKRKGEI